MNRLAATAEPAALQATGRRVLEVEREALSGLLPRVDAAFARAMAEPGPHFIEAAI
mgnify:CR=1 FL=1